MAPGRSTMKRCDSGIGSSLSGWEPPGSGTSASDRPRMTLPAPLRRSSRRRPRRRGSRRRSTLDVPRWLLPHAGRPDDVLLVSVEQGTDRTVVTIVRDVAATERARAAARQAVDDLKRRDPGGDVIL